MVNGWRDLSLDNRDFESLRRLYAVLSLNGQNRIRMAYTSRNHAEFFDQSVWIVQLQSIGQHAGGN